MRHANKNKEKPKEDVNLPSLLKGDGSRIKSSKLKPLDDKISQSKLLEKQKHL